MPRRALELGPCLHTVVYGNSHPLRWMSEWCAVRHRHVEESDRVGSLETDRLSLESQVGRTMANVRR